MIIAHRGVSFDLPENSLPAFNISWNHAADGIEGDFHLTKDGAIVCIHDEDTGRVCKQNLIVRDSTLKELKALDLDYKGTEYLQIKIPTLAEVLEILPDGKKIFIEVKCGSEIVKPLLGELSRSKLNSNDAVIISFDEEVIKEFKLIAPNYRSLLLYSYEAGCNINNLIDVMRNIKADGLGTDNELSKTLVEQTINAGFEYHSWTIDSIHVAQKLINWGSSSITTNKPGHLIQQLS
ncbi:MAG TPA: glycerophosphodiester phosphodiesterase [Candidatus Thioglobus sp.]|nr:glycerophosphodiester phosphodiesterase [Candidatus Thioglobus sp.]